MSLVITDPLIASKIFDLVLENLVEQLSEAVQDHLQGQDQNDQIHSLCYTIMAVAKQVPVKVPNDLQDDSVPTVKF